MKCAACWMIVVSLGISAAASAQIKRTTIPLGDAVDRALAKGSLTYGDVKPFHIRASITEPENP